MSPPPGVVATDHSTSPPSPSSPISVKSTSPLSQTPAPSTSTPPRRIKPTSVSFADQSKSTSSPKRNSSMTSSKSKEPALTGSALSLAEALAGVTGSMFATSLTYPIELAKTHVQLQAKGLSDTNYSGAMDALVQIFRKGGIRGNYRGVNGEFTKDGVKYFTSFFWYSQLKEMYKRRLQQVQREVERKQRLARLSGLTSQPLSTHQEEPEEVEEEHIENEDESKPKAVQISFWANSLIGIMSSIITAIVVNPLVVTQIRIQSRKKGSPDAAYGVLKTMLYLVSTGGLKTLFSGIIPSLILTLNPAIQFVLNDRLITWYRNYKRRRVEQRLATAYPTLTASLSSRRETFDGKSPGAFRTPPPPQSPVLRQDTTLHTITRSYLKSSAKSRSSASSTSSSSSSAADAAPAPSIRLTPQRNGRTVKFQDEVPVLKPQRNGFHHKDRSSVDTAFNRVRFREMIDNEAALNSLEYFLIGTLAKAVATILTYPYILAKVLLSHNDPATGKKYAGTLQVLRELLRNQGVSGLYQGLQPQLVRSMLSAGILFTSQARLQQTLCVPFVVFLVALARRYF